MSQAPNKSLQKMCKSPKNTSFQVKQQEKIDYESMNTNCTVVGSNNLNLVKKPQLVASMSPAYSNPSPSYPQSPYSSPASLKSPSPNLKPPTPQPNHPFPVMQIIHNNLLTRPLQTQQQNIIKLKPHLNILPKPSASPQPSPKPSVSPQIVIPAASQAAAAATATLMPTAQPLLLNQMQMLTAPGVQFILRPQTATQMTTTGPKLQANGQPPQGLILQPACGTQQLLQLGAPARSQSMVRVLSANGVQLAPTSTTYVTTQMANQPINATHIQQTIVNNAQQQQQQQQQQIHIQHQVVKKKPKVKGAKKRLDLANIMKLSGIGDEDDIQFESDTSQSESEHNSVSTTPQPASQQHQPVTPTGLQSQMSFVQTEPKKNVQNIQISAMPQQTINATSPVVQVLNQNFHSGMISNSSQQAATAHTGTGLPFNSTFITPNFTINNGGLMLQRSGGFKLTVGEDGRLVLQHDPTLNQDLQSQLLLQSLLGLNGGLVLQPSMDQQTVQQTVQTIQQQSVQTIQQQTVQSQTIQTVQQQTVQPQVQHTIQSLQPQIQQQTVQQTIQHQTVNALQQPMQIVSPQPINSIHSQVHNLQSQIQSLLQQQNVAVQAQAVHHQTVPHSQAIQNVQNLAQSSVQNVVAQNLAQNIAAQTSVQNVVQQNITQGVQNVQSGQSQPIQTSVHSVSGFQQAHTQTTQPILKVQPFQKSQPPVQSVPPTVQHHLPHHHHQQQQQHNLQDNNQPSNPTSYVVNLTPDQLEQLKRNGQVTVNGQTIFMQRPNKEQNDKKLSPKSKPVKKVSEIQSGKLPGKALLQDSPHGDMKSHLGGDQIKSPPPPAPPQHIKPLSSPSGQSAKQHIIPHNHVQPIQNKPQQAMVPPSIQHHQTKIERQKSPMPSPKQHNKVSPTILTMHDSNGANSSHDVDKLLGQILEESGSVHSATPNNNNLNVERQGQQRITTIQLTPQKQQHLKNIQMQIHTLSARLQPGDTDSPVHNALKALFAEQQKILASGKLLTPDKVYYLNNHLTIVNPSNMNLPSPVGSVKSEPPSPVLGPVAQHQQSSRSGSSSAEGSPPSSQAISTVSSTSPRVSVSVSTSTGDLPTHSTIHHHPTPVLHHNNNVHPNANIMAQTAPHIITTHSNHLIGQRVMGQMSQLPPLYPKPNQLHTPQLQSPKMLSPQMPSPQPQQQQHQANGQQQGLVHHHMQQINPAQMVKPKQPSPPVPQIKNQHSVDQSGSMKIFQHPQVPQQQVYQHRPVLAQPVQIVPKQPAPVPQQPQMTLGKKAHLIEQQLTIDQQEVANPNVHQAFQDKKDACNRLLRYHCLDQPVLSQQDLQKADEIFELTAAHFVTKLSKMSDKYKYLCMKESMRQVQTSELMMLDRMFLADEQQSLMRLRQDYEANIMTLAASDPIIDEHESQQEHAQMNETDSQEEYDEWACIQRELGCLPDSKEMINNHNNHHQMAAQSNNYQQMQQQNNLKRTSSSDSRLETLKRFRVDKHTKKHEPMMMNQQQSCNIPTSMPPPQLTQMKCGYESQSSAAPNYGCKEDETENNSIDEQVQSAINSILNLQQSQTQQQQQQQQQQQNNQLDLDNILS